MDESIDVTAAGMSAGPGRAGKPVVLVPYYSTIEKECEEGLRVLVKAGVALSRFSLSAIDLLRSAMLSHALTEGLRLSFFSSMPTSVSIPAMPCGSGEARARRRGGLCPQQGARFCGNVCAGDHEGRFRARRTRPLSHALRADRVLARSVPKCSDADDR